MAHIIAEAGTNHNGSIDEAKNLVQIAKKAGADSVKFQVINPWGLYLPGQYEYGNYDINKVIELRKKTQFTNKQFKELASFANQQGIELSASVFDKDGLDLLNELNAPYIKIASSDLNNLRFLRQVAKTQKKIILSTGMSTLSEIDKSVNEISKQGNENIVLMHCVSVYPAKEEETRLEYISIFKKKFGFEIGLSDHTQSSLPAAIAIGLGASWVEKHFTSNKMQEGLDHAYAMEPEELKNYVEDLRKAEKAVKVPEEKISERERFTKKRARRSLYAARDMKAGEKIRDDDVLCVRPEGPMRADEIDDLVGKILNKPVKQYNAFTHDVIR